MRYRRQMFRASQMYCLLYALQRSAVALVIDALLFVRCVTDMLQMRCRSYTNCKWQLLHVLQMLLAADRARYGGVAHLHPLFSLHSLQVLPPHHRPNREYTKNSPRPCHQHLPPWPHPTIPPSSASAWWRHRGRPASSTLRLWEWNFTSHSVQLHVARCDGCREFSSGRDHFGGLDAVWTSRPQAEFLHLGRLLQQQRFPSQVLHL